MGQFIPVKLILKQIMSNGPQKSCETNNLNPPYPLDESHSYHLNLKSTTYNLTIIILNPNTNQPIKRKKEKKNLDDIYSPSLNL